MKKVTHDLVIIGGGPAGLAAAIYAARYRIDFVLISQIPGGNMTESYDVENYPGLEETIPGDQLSLRMIAQLGRFGYKPKIDNIQNVQKIKRGFILSGNETEYQTKTVIFAMGMSKNKLGVPGENEFEGRGVAYCATCDGFFYRDKVVAIVGGGDSAVTAAIYLSDIAKKTYLLVRKPELRAAPIWQEKLRKNKRIKTFYETNVKEIKGHEKVESVVFEKGDKKAKELSVDGIFIEIGQTPPTILMKKAGVRCTDKDLIVVKQNQRTSVRGIWAAGDITTGSNGLRQIVTAAAEGAVAAVDIFGYLKKL